MFDPTDLSKVSVTHLGEWREELENLGSFGFVRLTDGHLSVPPRLPIYIRWRLGFVPRRCGHVRYQPL